MSCISIAGKNVGRPAALLDIAEHLGGLSNLVVDRRPHVPLTWDVAICTRFETQSHVRGFQVADHLLRISSVASMSETSELFSTFSAASDNRQVLPGAGIHCQVDLNTLVSGFGVRFLRYRGMPLLVDLTSVLHVSSCLDRGSFLIAHVTKFLLLAQHPLLVLSYLSFVVSYDVPIDVRRSLVHGGFVETLVMLLSWSSHRAHHFRLISVPIMVLSYKLISHTWR